jgi:hypothetical protein
MECGSPLPLSDERFMERASTSNNWTRIEAVNPRRLVAQSFQTAGWAGFPARRPIGRLESRPNQRLENLLHSRTRQRINLIKPEFYE